MDNPTREFIEVLLIFLYNLLWTYRLWIIYEKCTLPKILDYIQFAHVIENDSLALLIPIIQAVASLIYNEWYPFNSQNTDKDYWISIEITIFGHRRSVIQMMGDINFDWPHFCEVVLRCFGSNLVKHDRIQMILILFITSSGDKQRFKKRKTFPLNSNTFTLV